MLLGSHSSVFLFNCPVTSIHTSSSFDWVLETWPLTTIKMIRNSNPAVQHTILNTLSKIGMAGSIRALCPLRMENESCRFATFCNWPGDDYLPSGEVSLVNGYANYLWWLYSFFLAFHQRFVEAGFIYRGREDQVQCFKCRLVLSQWHQSHDPLTEHRRYSPDCAFLRSRAPRLEAVSDISLDSLTPLIGIAMEAIHTPITHNTSKNIPSETTIPSSHHSCDKSLCKVCCINEIQIFFQPCGHVLACISCAERLSSCAVCRSPIHQKLRAYISFE